MVNITLYLYVILVKSSLLTENNLSLFNSCQAEISQRWNLSSLCLKTNNFVQSSQILYFWIRPIIKAVLLWLLQLFVKDICSTWTWWEELLCIKLQIKLQLLSYTLFICCTALIWNKIDLVINCYQYTLVVNVTNFFWFYVNHWL